MKHIKTTFDTEKRTSKEEEKKQNTKLSITTKQNESKSTLNVTDEQLCILCTNGK